jgi:excisionase family DNA binding protein
MARWVTVTEAAKYLKTSRSALYNEISRGSSLGLFFKKKDGLKRLADLDAIDAWLNDVEVRNG